MQFPNDSVVYTALGADAPRVFSSRAVDIEAEAEEIKAYAELRREFMRTYLESLE